MGRTPFGPSEKLFYVLQGGIWDKIQMNPNVLRQKIFLTIYLQQVTFEVQTQSLGYLTWMYFIKRWHLPQRERGLPVAANGEKDTSINSSIPAEKKLHRCWNPTATFSMVKVTHLSAQKVWERSLLGQKQTKYLVTNMLYLCTLFAKQIYVLKKFSKRAVISRHKTQYISASFTVLLLNTHHHASRLQISSATLCVLLWWGAFSLSSSQLGAPLSYYTPPQEASLSTETSPKRLFWKPQRPWRLEG